MIKCSIIRDLFTAYISGAGSDDTRALVDEHNETCEDCRNKLAEVQNRVVAQLRENDAESINVFKTVKKRIKKRTVLAAAIASVVAIMIAFGGFLFVFHHETPITYSSDRIWVEGGRSGSTARLQLILNEKSHSGSHSTSRIVNVNGVDTKVIYLYLVETLSTRWLWESRGGGVLNLVLAGKDVSFVAGEHMLFGLEDLTLPLEIYYLVAPFDEWLPMNSEDFYEQRSEGVLLWSGTLFD